ncbi:hypothetical protein GX51_06419 [Blastomyces parvus]|uniref:UmuC domain-containing protein n=1 Tax=Blastomyces parvus TaxID=2060905 RepID=A0A2B7WRP0_9EURO|nr:hypothetical protein GX51_06419 [Blastomyces parvus]
MANLFRKNQNAVSLRRDDSRIILHFDYDCFYASVFEAENPALKSLPLAVQQKQIVVTCNYEARRRGLRKLQLIKEAKKVCPDVVIVPGEDLTRFRDASKEIYAFLGEFVAGWGGRAERLGFDEVFLDVTSLVDYNIELLNHNDRSSSFFHLDKTDPTQGFAYDARTVSGPSYPSSGQIIHTSLDGSAPSATSDSQTHPFSPNSKNNANGNLQLHQRLILGSHLASYIRRQLEEHKSYTATVGISTSKLLAKLAGNVHKPRNQTTLLPPYNPTKDDGAYVDHDDDDNDDDADDAAKAAQQQSNITRFLDAHDISAIPGIGFKIAQRIRRHVLGRGSASGIYEQLSKADCVTVKDVRLHPNMGPLALNELLLLSSNSNSNGGSGGGVGGGGALPKDIGMKIWGLLHGIDPSPVAEARAVPTQISIEDSYGDGRLEGLDVVRGELVALAKSLLRRMVADLTEEVEEVEGEENGEDGHGDCVQSEAERMEKSRRGKATKRRWLAHPRTFRLSTRIRLPPLPDGAPDFSAGRVSRSCAMPTYIFSPLLNTSPTTIANNNRNYIHNDENNNDDVNDNLAATAAHEAMTTPTIDSLAIRLVNETILPLFRRLHPEKSGAGKICVMNIAVTNMVMVAGASGKGCAGRDIGRMFRSQKRVLRQWRGEDGDRDGEYGGVLGGEMVESTTISNDDIDDHVAGGDGDAWDSDGDEGDIDILGNGDAMMTECAICGALMPHFALRAHEVYHSVCP